MMKAMTLVAIAAAMTAAPTFADTSDARLQKVTETVCAADQKVVFMPVSYDQPKLRATYAVLPADDMMVDGVDIVTQIEREWLEQNGCNSPKSPDLLVSKETKPQDQES